MFKVILKLEDKMSSDDGIKQRISIILYILLAIAFMYGFSYKIMCEQYIDAGMKQICLNGNILFEPVLFFTIGILSVVLLSKYLVDQENKKYKLFGNLFFYLFCATIIYSLFQWYNLTGNAQPFFNRLIHHQLIALYLFIVLVYLYVKRNKK